nr:hypothetical protein [Paenibacillus bovis]
MQLYVGFGYVREKDVVRSCGLVVVRGDDLKVREAVAYVLAI